MSRKRRRNRDRTLDRERTAAYGGIANDLAGIGGPGDKAATSYYTRPTYTQTELDNAYRVSWAAQKFVDILVDDAFHLRRTLEGGPEDYNDQIQQTFHLDERLRTALKAARLYGTALLITASNEAPLDVPLDVERIMQGDVTNLWIAGRYQCETVDLNMDPWSEDYGLPTAYRVRNLNGRMLVVDSSRVIRFDGIRATTPTEVDQGWGISVLAPILNSIKGEDLAATAASQGVVENSIFVQQMDNWDLAMRGAPPGGVNMSGVLREATMQSHMKSSLRTLYVGKNDNVFRVNVPLTGVDKVMETLAKRMAAAAGIPYTRFMSQSPAGMNATGESDARNYALLIGSKQRDWLEGAYRRLDAILSRSLGIAPPVGFDFPSLYVQTEEEKARTHNAALAYVNGLLGAGIISPEGAREYMLAVDPRIATVQEGVLPTAAEAAADAEEEDEED